MSGHPGALPGHPAPSLKPSRKRRLSPLRVIAVTLVSLFVVVVLVAAYLAAAYPPNPYTGEDSRTEGLIVVQAQTDLHDMSDPLPADISEEDYAAFWAEPALNTPDALALLDVINEGWKARLEEDMEYNYLRVDGIGDAAKRANAQAAVDEVADSLSRGTVQAAKRVVYEDLAQLSRQTCHRGKVEGVSYLANGHPIRNWVVTHPQVLSLRGSTEYTQRVKILVGKVYPAAFEAALPHICTFPPPPESSHPGDAELMFRVAREGDNLMELLKTRPNAEGQLPEDEYEAFWNSPVMTSPEVQAYIDRVGEKAVSDHRASAAYMQNDIDQITDPGVREHAQKYLDGVLEEAARDNGRRLAVGKLYGDLEQYWADTCVNPPGRWGYPTSIKRSGWISRFQPDFSPDYVTSARSSRDAEWSAETYDQALQFYPEAYEAGLGYFCT